MINIKDAKIIIANSLDSFYKNNETLNLQQLQAECINNACLYFLQKTTGMSGMSLLGMSIRNNPQGLGEIFGKATQELIPQFSDAMIANTGLAVMQNTQWEGIEDFLINYFYKVHNKRITL